MITHIEQHFSVKRPPEEVFDYVVDPSNASAWQSTRVDVEFLTESPLRRGTRIRERAKALGIIPVEQITEITGFERPSYVEVTALAGPVMPMIGSYTFTPEGDETHVHFSYKYGATGLLERILVPLTRTLITRRLAGWHRRLVRILEAG